MQIKDLLGELATELESEKERAMTPEEKTFHAVAQKLLLLERDLRAPGSLCSPDARIDRLLETIAKETF
jgi:hypothetical protein